MDTSYSVSPDGHLSLLVSLDKESMEIGRHPNDSSIWFPFEDDINSADKLWMYDRIGVYTIHDELVTILQVVAVDTDRFVYIGENEDELEIGVIEIEWQPDDTVILKNLNFDTLSIDSIYTILAYDIQLGSNVYLISNANFMIYNFQTFEFREVSWSDTTNMSFFGDPLSLLILDPTHLIIGAAASVNDDCPLCPTIALVEIDLNSSLLDMYVISYQIIVLYDEELSSDSVLHISLSINTHGNLLIGLPEADRVIFAHLNMNERQLVLTNRTFPMKAKFASFGYSVAWFPDQRQFAVNAYHERFEGLSHSQIFIFNFDDDELWIRTIFPSNQQVISKPAQPLYFHKIILLHGIYFGILASKPSEQLLLFILPMTSGGTGMFDFDMDFFEPFPYIFGTIVPCLPGMYKNDNASISPCFPCPIGTKAPNYGSLQCEVCSDPIKCPLGSIKDRQDYPRITQTVTYPESSSSTAFDDIILSNMFTFECLLISPVFWMFIIISIVTFFLFIICLIGLFPRMFRYRLRILRAFKHIDLVGQGHLWSGGIVSCGICVLVVFAAIFSVKFIHLYPIEHMSPSSLICNPQMHNAKFTSGLQLMALPKSDEERPIFELLDEQPFNLTLDLINTLIDCAQIDITQQIGEYFGYVSSFDCSKDETNVTVSLVIPLPSHLTRTNIYLFQSYTVGSVRVCLKGLNKTTLNGRYELRELFVCEIFFDPNDTMSSRPEFDITLTKVINRTEPLDNGDLPNYAGLWIPLISGKDVTTKLLHGPVRDDYYYLFPLSSLIIIRQTESQFYIYNKQEPIARKFEVFFHNILFLGVIIELFGLAFLISKLLLLPFGRLTLNKFTEYYFSDKNRKTPTIVDIEKTCI